MPMLSPAEAVSLAGALQLSSAALLRLIDQLQAQGLVQAHQRELALTPDGQIWALRVVRAHRLWERYLADEARLPLEKVHGEAHHREHGMTTAQVDELDAALGHPISDPHGDPIPDSSLRIPASTSRSLVDLALGDTATVARVPDSDAALLRYLAEIAIVPGQELELMKAAPFGGPLTVRTGTGEHAIARELAATVGIESRLVTDA
jgi:DtxR family Mn-dependent transcriptional regulator